MAGPPRIKVNNHHTFYYQYETTLLDALEVQEIPAPYNCRGGYCGCCKVRLIEGDVILTCCCIPKTHIELELPED
jgi:ferredoxin